MSAIKPEFDEYGVAEDVLAELQHVSPKLSLSCTKRSASTGMLAPYDIEMGEQSNRFSRCRVRSTTPTSGPTSCLRSPPHAHDASPSPLRNTT
jgi:hypothetical protein